MFFVFLTIIVVTPFHRQKKLLTRRRRSRTITIMDIHVSADNNP